MSFMAKIIERAGLTDIAEKVFAAQRITDEEGLRLYGVKDLNALGYLANHVRERKNGNVATYVLNLYLNYSNICILSCQFCAFARRPHEKEGQFTYDIDEMARRAKEEYDKGATEVHIVGGLHPKLPFEYYTEMIKALKAACPDLTVKAFTAIEIRHLAERIAKKPIRETLEILRDCGLSSLTGGGAEIFDPEVRDKLCRGKESAEEWLAVHRTWHQMGQRSTCTMLYGHVETTAHRMDHLRRLRELQDETQERVSAGFGNTRNVALTMPPSVPSDPTMSLGTSKPATFFTTFPPLRARTPSARTISTPTMRSLIEP